MRALANTAANSKDAREILRPNLPEMYGGNPAQLKTFLTQCWAFMSYYPIQFATKPEKTRYAAECLKDTAANWFQSILEDWTNKGDIEDLVLQTYIVYTNYLAFEKAL